MDSALRPAPMAAGNSYTPRDRTGPEGRDQRARAGRVGVITWLECPRSATSSIRRRLQGTKPFAFHDAFLPAELGIRLARLDLTHTTLFRELARMPGIKLIEMYLHIDAVAADVPMARLLEVDVGAPLLVTRRAVDHARTGAPTMFFETYFRADRYYYSVMVDQRQAIARATKPHRKSDINSSRLARKT